MATEIEGNGEERRISGDSSNQSSTNAEVHPENCDRRKRKSTDDDLDIAHKRTKIEDQPAEESSPASSSSSSTSGADVTESSSPKESSVAKSLDDFKVFEYNDTLEPKSALKTASRSDKPQRSIKFSVVREFKFARAPSFVTMPTSGGYSLGMEKRHASGREVTLDRYRIERERSKRRRYRRWCQNRQTLDVENDISDSDSDTENDESLTNMSQQAHSCPLPVPPERRKLLLTRNSDQTEKEIEADYSANEVNIRSSRENCGCSCKGICYPESCECHLNGIGCQVDRLYFPCGCLPARCYNQNGRTSFSVDRVRAHLALTLDRLNRGVEFDQSSEQQVNQSYSFGDFTLPNGNPPPRPQFGGIWNQCYWNEYSYDPWNSMAMNGNNTFQQMDQLKSPPQQYHCHQMENLVCTEPNNDTGIIHTTEPHIESLSESSESAFGDDNMVSPQPQTEQTFQTPSTTPRGLETSIQLPYTEDSNHSVPLSVGSE